MSPVQDQVPCGMPPFEVIHSEYVIFTLCLRSLRRETSITPHSGEHCGKSVCQSGLYNARYQRLWCKRNSTLAELPLSRAQDYWCVMLITACNVTLLLDGDLRFTVELMDLADLLCTCQCPITIVLQQFFLSSRKL